MLLKTLILVHQHLLFLTSSAWINLVKTFTYFHIPDQETTRSFCNRSLIDLLGSSGSTEEITLQIITGAQTNPGQIVSLCVSSLGNNKKYAFGVLSVPNIPVALNPLPTKRDLHLYAHLNNITFPRVPRKIVP